MHKQCDIALRIGLRSFWVPSRRSRTRSSSIGGPPGLRRFRSLLLRLGRPTDHVVVGCHCRTDRPCGRGRLRSDVSWARWRSSRRALVGIGRRPHCHADPGCGAESALSACDHFCPAATSGMGTIAAAASPNGTFGSLAHSQIFFSADSDCSGRGCCPSGVYTLPICRADRDLLAISGRSVEGFRRLWRAESRCHRRASLPKAKMLQRLRYNPQ